MCPQRIALEEEENLHSFNSIDHSSSQASWRCSLLVEFQRAAPELEVVPLHLVRCGLPAVTHPDVFRPMHGRQPGNVSLLSSNDRLALFVPVDVAPQHVRPQGGLRRVNAGSFTLRAETAAQVEQRVVDLVASEKRTRLAFVGKNSAVFKGRTEVVAGQLFDRDSMVRFDRGVDQISRPVIIDEQPEISRLGFFHFDVRIVNRERPLRLVGDGNGILSVPERRIPVVPEDILLGLRVVLYVGAIACARGAARSPSLRATSTA